MGEVHVAALQDPRSNFMVHMETGYLLIMINTPLHLLHLMDSPGTPFQVLQVPTLLSHISSIHTLQALRILTIRPMVADDVGQTTLRHTATPVQTMVVHHT